MSEAKRGLVRIVANYARLAATLLIGLTVTRLLIGELGADAFGLIALLGSTIGITAMVRTVVRNSLVRELGKAYHEGDSTAFVKAVNAALAICLVAAAVCAGGFGLLMLAVPWLSIPEELATAARWFILAKGAHLALTLALGPFINMYLISERMVAFNLHHVGTRASELLAVAIVIVTVPTVSEGVVMFGVWSAVLASLTSVGFATAMVLRDSRLRPSVQAVSREGIGGMLSISKWNVLTTTAMNLHLPLGALIMNLAFGVAGNMVFGLAVQLSSYSRMVATGMTSGLDAVATRFSAGTQQKSLGQLLHHATRLHALVVFPAIGATLVLAEPLLAVWVGPRLEDPTEHLPVAAVLVKVLAVGIGVRAISDGWVRILYGAGYVHRYAWWILGGGVANPLLALALIGTLPATWNYVGPAMAFSLILTAVHGGIVPMIAARCLTVSLRDIYGPLVRPLLATLLAVPVLLLGRYWIDLWTLPILATVGALYGVIYLTLVLAVVLTSEDWQRLVKVFRRWSERKVSTPRTES